MLRRFFLATLALLAVAQPIVESATSAQSFKPTRSRVGRSGLRVPAIATGAYDSDAQAYFAGMSVQPDATRKALLNDLIVGLKSDGVWLKQRGFWVLAAHDAQAARVNAKQPGSSDLNAINSPSFTVDRGFTGDGSSSYLDTGMTTEGFQNDSSMGFWSLSDIQSGAVDMGNAGSLIAARNGSDATLWRVNQGSSVTSAGVTNGTGLFTVQRNGAASVTLYRNASLIISNSSASQTPGNSLIRILSRSNTVTYSSRTGAFAFIGTSLTAAEVASIHSRVSTYLAAIGAI